MKKFWSFVLSVLMLITVSGCGKSDAVKAADGLILSIGNVTLDSGAAILSAEDAVGKLTEKELKSLDSASILEQARTDYNALLVADIENMIDGIGSVTVYSGASIEAVRSIYNQLPADLKPSIGNYSILTKAEEQYALAQGELQRIENSIEAIGSVTLQSREKIESARYRFDNAPQATQEAVKNIDVLLTSEQTYSELCVENVLFLIESIGTVTMDSKSIIETARTEYDALSFQEQKLIETYTILTAAEDNLAQLAATAKENEYTSARNSLRAETDKVEGTTWYISTQQPQYANSRCYVFPYIGQNDQDTWLRLKFNYTGDDWVFYESVTIWVDGDRHSIDFDYSGINRDNKRGDVWEIADISPSESNIDMLWDIANSEETIVRFQADHVHHDFTIREKDKAGIKNVLIVYDHMISANNPIA